MIRLLPLRKYLKVAYSLLANKRAGEAIYPFYASFKLTTRCHFSCPFCSIKDDKRPDSTTEKIMRTLDNLSESSVILVSFEGGEPLLRQDIAELLRYARSRNFYLLFTTSERHLERYPMKEYARYIDFIHISIDEGHDNLQMFDRLREYRDYGAQLSIQVVVTRETLPALEEKARKCMEADANLVVMPAVKMNRTQDFFPDLERFEKEILRLRELFPRTLYIPSGYFEAVRQGRCSTGSVVIDSDCGLYYPCHILESKGPDLSQVPLHEFLLSPDGRRLRKEMRECRRGCGWYQYFSITDFTSLGSVLRALRPAMSKRFKRFRNEI